MEINTNSIGNYSPYNSTVSMVRQTENIAVTKEANNTNVISKEEETFFAEMYPENKSEIIDYHYYKSSGQMSGVTVGSLFDRRG